MKKKKRIIQIIIIAILVIIIGIVVMNKNSELEYIKQEYSKSRELKVDFDEDTQIYSIIDTNGNVLAQTTEEGMVEILLRDPEHNPRFPWYNKTPLS